MTPPSQPTSSGQDELREQVLRRVDEILVWIAQYAHDVALTGEMKPDDGIDQYARQKTDEIMSLVAHHTQEAVEAAQAAAANTTYHKLLDIERKPPAERVGALHAYRLSLATLASTDQPKLNQGEADE